MRVTQLFRLAGSTKTEVLECDLYGDKYVIYWEDIEDVFPGVQYLKDNNTVVKRLRETGPDGTVRQRIERRPGVALTVVLSNTVTSNPAISPSGRPKVSPTCHQTSVSLGTSMSNRVIDGPVINTSGTGMHAEIIQCLADLLSPDIQAQAHASQDIHGSVIQALQDGGVRVNQSHLTACLQELNQKVDKNNELVSDVNMLALGIHDLVSLIVKLMIDVKDLTTKNNMMMDIMTELQKACDSQQKEFKQLQMEALNHLSQLPNRVKALMTQTFELHEYPIPRLFVILPQNTTVNILSDKFRLHFLCECGEHTKLINPGIPHQVHLTEHEGYEIKRPTRFFQRYGKYVLTLLKMLKFGLNAAGVIVPAISPFVHSDPLNKAAGTLKALSTPGVIPKGIDQAIKRLEKDTGAFDGNSDPMRNGEALEGTDLRKLESFLKNKDGNNVLGNLYRTVTPEGHVKWVCIKHYRGNDQEDPAKDFREKVVSLGGTFDENVGRAKVHLRSKQDAEQLYQALDKAKLVYELEVALDWKTASSDFKQLRDTLKKSNVGALVIDLKGQEGPNSDFLNRNKRHDPIFDIMRHHFIRSVEILRAPEDFNNRSSQLSEEETFPRLMHMGLDLRSNTRGIKTLSARSPKLSSLALNDPMTKGVFGFFNTLQPLGDLFESVNSMHIHLRSKIRLQSSLQAEEAYRALEKAKSFHQLDIDLGENTAQRDFERLSDFLDKSNVGSLKLRVNLKGNLAGGVSNHFQRHDSIFDIMRHPSTHSVSIMGAPRDFVRQSSLLGQSEEFPSLRHMEIDLTKLKEDIPSIKCLIVNAPDLSSLDLQGDIDDSILLRLFMAIAEHQTCPINLASKQLCIPPLTTAPNQSLDSHQYLAHLLNVDGVRIDQLVLEGCTDEEAIVEAFAKVERDRTGLKELTIRGVCKRQGEQFIQNVARIVSRSELDRLVIQLEGEERRVKILESIQWKHIRHLSIDMHTENVGRLAVEALVNGRDNVEGPVELESFQFNTPSSETITAEHAELVRSFVASTLVNGRHLLVVVPSNTESMVKAAAKEEIWMRPGLHTNWRP
ncbi:hypothetical protein B0O80DRAFT_259384 [Mortierella sp. GBAus27b]|nr:hypothetical protein BGX31_011480 [Mortierella sp. GBA43]KAI8358974.1 hypothetical protein B0O80DRAFT_259384 [Mortierella sp. GBAus27b]